MHLSYSIFLFIIIELRHYYLRCIEKLAFGISFVHTKKKGSHMDIDMIPNFHSKISQ